MYLGLNWLNTLVGLMLRMFGFCRNVIFYSIDFVERRFNSYLLNSVYHVFDIVVASKSDLIWNLGENIAKIRSQRWRFKARLNQLVVPYGTFRIEMKQRLNEYAFIHRWKEKRVCFLGHLRSGQGLELLPGVVRLLLPYFPDLKLIIIGDGELKDSLKRGFEKLGIKNNVVFLGLVNEDRLYLELSRVTVGLAPYPPRSLASYSDPAKVKAYLSFGIPVVITPYTSISKEVKNASAGIVCTYEEEAIAAAIKDILSNYDFYKKLVRGTLHLAERYFWDVLYEHAIVRTLQIIKRNTKGESD
jgi:glycosyltransferase involved in cell wall biosynthesis